MHPRSVHIMRKNPVFDERVHIDFSTYHSLDESQKEMLKEYGLIVIISLINSNATRVGLFYLPQYSLLFFIATKKIMYDLAMKLNDASLFQRTWTDC